MLNQVFGKMLYYPQSEPLAEFPSPESLKHRIIISTKPPKEYLEKVTKTGLNNIKGNEENLQELESAEDSDPDDFEVSESPSKSSSQAAPEYKKLITIHAGKPKGRLRDALKTAAQVKRLSLSEQELERAALSYGTDVVRYRSSFPC